MSVKLEDCDSRKARKLPEESADDGGLPFSSGFPAFTCVNRMRRIMCRFCKTPIGYAGMDMCHLEAAKGQATKEAKLIKDDRLYGSVCIESPINVSLRPVRKDAIAQSDQEKPFGSYVVEDAQKKHSEAEEVWCDHCQATLGARITEYGLVRSMESGDWGGDLDCGVVPERIERARWFAFSEDALDIEPLFGLVGSNELSRFYHGGERFSNELIPIEASEAFSNDSGTWFKPYERRSAHISSETQGTYEAWPRFYMDLVRQDRLPRGTLGRRTDIEVAIDDTRDAFEKMQTLRKLPDDSAETPQECCSGAVNTIVDMK